MRNVHRHICFRSIGVSTFFFCVQFQKKASQFNTKLSLVSLGYTFLRLFNNVCLKI